MYGYGLNPYYFMFMVPGLIISMWASFKVKSTFNRYSKVSIANGLTGAMAARQILDLNGLQHVAIEHIAGNLSDHYDPKANVIRLSDSTFNSASVGAVGVAAHECGHAVQYAVGYGPIKLRMAIVPICNIGTKLSVPLILVGMVLSMFNLAYVGIALFSLAVLFQLVTLPVEFNASARAIKTLNSTGLVTAEESSGVKKVLTAAALTYVAALLTSLLQLLYYIAMVGGKKNSR